MTYRLRNIAIAVGLAIIAALLTTFYVTNYKRTVQRGAEDVTVYVATKDIVAGTPGSEVLESGLLKTQEIARRNVAPGAISSPDQIARLVAVDPVYAGEQVTVTRFRPSEEKGVRSELSGNLRAIQVPGSEHQLLAGTLKAGDHVDVVASLSTSSSTSSSRRRTPTTRSSPPRGSSCATCSSCAVRPRRARPRG